MLLGSDLQFLIISNYTYRFQNISIGWPGRAHDARVLANSELFAKGQNGTLFPQVCIFKVDDNW